MVGLSYPYLSQIENGRKRPSSRALLAIAEALGTKPHELLTSANELATTGNLTYHPNGAQSPDAAATNRALPTTDRKLLCSRGPATDRRSAGSGAHTADPQPAGFRSTLAAVPRPRNPLEEAAERSRLADTLTRLMWILDAEALAQLVELGRHLSPLSPESGSASRSDLESDLE